MKLGMGLVLGYSSFLGILIRLNITRVSKETRMIEIEQIQIREYFFKIE